MVCSCVPQAITSDDLRVSHPDTPRSSLITLRQRHLDTLMEETLSDEPNREVSETVDKLLEKWCGGNWGCFMRYDGPEQGTWKVRILPVSVGPAALGVGTADPRRLPADFHVRLFLCMWQLSTSLSGVHVMETASSGSRLPEAESAARDAAEEAWRAAEDAYQRARRSGDAGGKKAARDALDKAFGEYEAADKALVDAISSAADAAVKRLGERGVYSTACVLRSSGDGVVEGTRKSLEAKFRGGKSLGDFMKTANRDEIAAMDRVGDREWPHDDVKR